MTKKFQFNFLVTPEEEEMITLESQRLRGTKSQVVRLALTTYFQLLEQQKEAAQAE